MARFKLPREFYIPKGAIKVADKASDAVAYLSINSKGKPRATIFFGKQAKPVADFWYRDDAAREQKVREYFEGRRARQAMMASHRQEATAFQHSARVGDIYSASWGYDQTNVNFFEIIEVKGKFAILREIAAASEYRGSGSDSVVAQSGQFLEPRYEGDDRGQPMRRLIQNGRIKINDTYSAYPWGKRDPITGTIIGRAMHQTAFGWGH